MKIYVLCAFFLFCAMPSSVFAQKTFHGFPCTKDCSGHIAGYEWAQRKSIASEEDCGGTSHSFREGCIAWVREQLNGQGDVISGPVIVDPEPPSALPETD